MTRQLTSIRQLIQDLQEDGHDIDQVLEVNLFCLNFQAVFFKVLFRYLFFQEFRGRVMVNARV